MSESIFPETIETDGNYDEKRISWPEKGGLTKRELFAGLAMQGMLAKGIYSLEQVAEDSAIYADALIKALKEGEGE